jgi:hypothetical protein
LLLVAFIMQRSGSLGGPDPTATPTPERFLEADVEQIVGLQVESAEGEALELIKTQDGQWQLAGLADGPADKNAVPLALDGLVQTDVIRTLGDEVNLDAAGLVSPRYKITLSLEGGAELEVFVGNDATVGGGYYVRTADGQPRIVNQFNLDRILEWLETPPLPPTPLPTILPTTTSTP